MEPHGQARGTYNIPYFAKATQGYPPKHSCGIRRS